ncbi:MAG: ribonuclease HII, partial [Planctomycetota bacterium]
SDFQSLSVSAIKAQLTKTESSALPNLLEKIKADPRVSVQKLAQQWEMMRRKQQSEEQRLEALQRFEKEARQKRFQIIAGVDEAGRGPLAGPVCVAACILPEKWDLPYLNDSKKLSEKKRLELEKQIKKQALAYSILLSPAEEIDRVNILQATIKTAYAVLAQLNPAPDYVLTDSLKLPKLRVPHRAIDHGDALSCSIAAASILAKTHRDRLLLELDAEFPQYGFKSHKGYGSAGHCQALQNYGPSTLHRLSFNKVPASSQLLHSKSFQEFVTRFQECRSLEQLESIGKEIHLKKLVLPLREISELRKLYGQKRDQLSTSSS